MEKAYIVHEFYFSPLLFIAETLVAYYLLKKTLQFFEDTDSHKQYSVYDTDISS